MKISLNLLLNQAPIHKGDVLLQTSYLNINAKFDSDNFADWITKLIRNVVMNY